MTARTHEPLGEAISRLARDLGDLFRAELRLFRAEALDDARALGVIAALGAASAFMLLLCVGAFTAFLIAALSVEMATSLAALIVFAVYLVVAAVLGAAAVAAYQHAKPIGFDRTAHSVKEDVAWITGDLKSAR